MIVLEEMTRHNFFLKQNTNKSKYDIDIKFSYDWVNETKAYNYQKGTENQCSLLVAMSLKK